MREIVTIPTSLKFGSFEMSTQTFDMDEVSDLTGSTDTVIYGHPRWRISMSAMDDMSLDDASEWEYITLALRGKANRLAVYDPVRIQPEGTMRGSPTLNASIGQGDTSFVINAGSGQAGKTLKRGDLLQIGTGLGTSQLVKVATTMTLNGSGVGTVEFNNYARRTFSSGTAVIWDRPVTYFGNMNKPTGPNYARNSLLVSGFAFDLLEQWT